MSSDKIPPEILKYQPGRKYPGRSQEALREPEGYCCPVYNAILSGRKIPYCMFHSTTLKMGAACSSEMLVPFNQNKQLHISEDSSLHIYCHKNLKSPV
jgi:hypothetical protein